MFRIMASEVRVSKGYEYMRAPFGLRETAARHIINNQHSERVRRQTLARESSRNKSPSSARPTIVIRIRARPRANPAWMLSQRIIKGASHQIEGVFSLREYLFRKLIKTLAKRRENICGRA